MAMAEPHNLSGDAPVLPPISVASSAQAYDAAPQAKDGERELERELERERDGGRGREAGNYYQAHGHHQISRHRFLSPAEWSIIATGIGGVGDGESQAPVHPSCWWWPPSGMPRGLYRGIVSHRTKFYLAFHASSILRATLMVLQLLLGAALTALGSMSLSNGTPITILGATNTVIAGLLALMHNSGLPDRFRYDMFQFEELEDYVKELLDSSLCPADQTTDQVLAECFDMFREAKATVAANMPVNYNSRRTLRAAAGSNENAAGSGTRPAPGISSRPPPAAAAAGSVVGGGDGRPHQ